MACFDKVGKNLSAHIKKEYEMIESCTSTQTITYSFKASLNNKKGGTNTVLLEEIALEFDL